MRGFIRALQVSTSGHFVSGNTLSTCHEREAAGRLTRIGALLAPAALCGVPLGH